MKVGMSYIFVVLIWATTPLSIQWSNSSLSFVEAITLRMVLALLVCLAVLLVLRRPIAQRKQDWNSYIAGAMGLFPNMLIVYWSAQYIPSGLMSVVLAFYPFAVGFFSWIILRENIFSLSKFMALVIAVLGLGIIHLDQMSLGGDAVWGVLGILLAAILWAMSTVWVKKFGASIDPIRQNTGALLIGTPLFILSWFFMDGTLPDSIDTKSMIGVGYLVVVGSVIGHALFYYVLNACSVASVSLVPLITPVMAMAIGYYFADEVFSGRVLVGAGLILFSLGIYQGVYGRFYKFVIKKAHNQRGNALALPTKGLCIKTDNVCSK